jgi:hypothetical protein
MTTVVLTSGTSWTVPPGVTLLTSVECWGAGGGGWLGGGGGGAYAAIANYSVTPGASIPISIGTGGVSVVDNGASPANDASGPTYFNTTSTVLADYGRGCQSGPSFAQDIGLGGSTANSIGTTLFAGGQGGFGMFQSNVSGFVNCAAGGGGSGSKLSAGSAGLGNFVQTSGPAQNGSGGNAGTGGGTGGVGNTASSSPGWNGANGVSNALGGGGGAASSYNGTSGETASAGTGGVGGFPGGGGGGAFALAGDGAGGQITITFVAATSTFGVNASTTGSASSGTSFACTGITTTLPNCVLVLFTCFNGSGTISVSSVTDTAGLTWTKRTATSVGAQPIEEWYAIAASLLSSNVITVNLSAANGYANAIVVAISGANTASPYDTNVSLPALSASATSVSVSTTAANTIILGGLRSNNATQTAGAGFALISGANFALVEYDIVSSAQTSLTVTSSSSSCNGFIGDAIAAASHNGLGLMSVGWKSILTLGAFALIKNNPKLARRSILGFS